MIDQLLFFYSPFSPATVAVGEGPSLLLQFILRELIRSENELVENAPGQLAPFDWAWKHGSKHKIREHLLLLPVAFPALAKEAENFLKKLHLPCSELLPLLEPFILACGKNENLLYFLLKHQKSKGITLMLDRICPEGLEKLKIDIVLQYQKRGFYPCKWID